MKKTLLILGAVFALASGAVGAPELPERETAVVVLSFISPVARESLNSYDYRMHKNSREAKNYPLPLTALPEKAVLYGQEGYLPLELAAAREHMKRIRESGFDLVFFDMLPIPDYDPAQALTFTNEPFYYFSNYFEWMKAAEENNLKLGIFADVGNQSARYPQYRSITRDEWVKILHAALGMIPESPAAWKVNGVDGVVHFGTDCVYNLKASPVPGAPMPDGGWREVWKLLREKGDEFFFVSDIRPHGRDGDWDGLADAAYLFAPAGPAPFMTEYQADISRRLRITPYYWTVSSGYHRIRRDYTQPDFSRLHDTYLAALRAGTRKIIVMTWNDLGEDHDIWPSANKGSELLDVVAFYNDWFKRGKQPEIVKEKLIVAYPFRAPAEAASKPPVYGGGKWASPAFEPKVFYWSALRRPKRVGLAGRTLELPAGIAMGEIPLDPGGDPASIPVGAKLDGRTVVLPPVVKTAREGDGGGREHRYVNLLGSAAMRTVGNPKTGWDFSKDDESRAEKSFDAATGITMNFTAVPGKHNWIYLRNHMPEGSVPADARFVRLAYTGKIPAGMKLLCVLQEEGGVSCSYELPLPEEAAGGGELIVPLAQFRRTGWSAASPVDIPTAARIRWGHIGPIGIPAEGDAAGTLTLRQFDFLK